MTAIRRKHRSVSAAASPLAIFLVGTIALALWLGYQALDAALSHRRTAEAVLSDYARISATEMANLLDDELDDLLDEVFDAVTSDRGRRRGSPSAEVLVEEMRDAVDDQRCDCPAFRSPVAVFRLSAESFQVLPDTLGSRVSLAVLDRIARGPARDEDEPGLFVLGPEVTGSRPLVIGYVRAEEVGRPPEEAEGRNPAPRREAAFRLASTSPIPVQQAPNRNPTLRPATYGFIVTREALAELIAEWYEEETLLPQPIAGEQPNDSLLHVTVVHRSAGTMFESHAGFPTQLSATLPVSDDFPDLGVTAAVRSDAASQLIIGGLPRSRLPLLSLLLVLTLGVGVAAAVQLRREQSFQRLRDDFVSGVSHELRTPLAQIRMFAELQQSGRLSGEKDAERATFVIHRESVRLSHLVENILQFSRLRRLPGKQLPVERLDFGAAILDGADAVAPLLEDRGMRLDIRAEPELEVIANRDALTRIVVNLLDNAIKYGPRGQSVTLHVERAADSARLSVTDEGEGVPPKDRERVFAPYYRMEKNVTSQIAGTGIGLSVVADLAALHMGRAWVEDGPAGGARFVVELPLAPPMLADEEGEQQEDVTGRMFSEDDAVA